MEKHNDNFWNSFIEIFKGENGPLYIGIMAVVAMVGSRYGYKIKGKSDFVEVSIEPNMEVGNNLIETEESSDIGVR